MLNASGYGCLCVAASLLSFSGFLSLSLPPFLFLCFPLLLWLCVCMCLKAGCERCGSPPPTSARAQRGKWGGGSYGVVVSSIQYLGTELLSFSPQHHGAGLLAVLDSGSSCIMLPNGTYNGTYLHNPYERFVGAASHVRCSRTPAAAVGCVAPPPPGFSPSRFVASV